MSMFHNKLTGVRIQAVRYFAVGISVVIIDFFTFLLLIYFFPQAYMVANIAGKSAGALIGFFIHKHFTFGGEQERSTVLQLLLYSCLYLANISLSSFVIYVGVEVIELLAVPAKIVADVLVTANSFVFSRFFVFKQKAMVD